jgi:hypothetical protein
MRARTIAIGVGSSLVAFGIGFGVVSLFERREIRRRAQRALGGFSHLPTWLPDLADFDDEEIEEAEPEGLDYDHDPPCRLPTQPWNTPGEPVAIGLEGAGDEPGFCIPPSELEPRPATQVTGRPNPGFDVAFADGAPRPGWPLDTSSDQRLKVSYQDVRGKWHGKWQREFGSQRKSKDKKTGATYGRVHVGMDLNANVGDIVYAPEDGEVIAALPFYKGLGAVYLLTDSGLIVNLGELEMGSWTKYGIRTGSNNVRVQQGDPLGRVGRSIEPDGKAGTHMLHVETYTPDTTIADIRGKKMRWIAGEPPPPGVLDPTRWLVRAQIAAYEDRIAAELEQT